MEEAERGWGGRGERVGGEEKAKKTTEGKGGGEEEETEGKKSTVVCTLYLCCVCLWNQRSVHTYCNDSLIIYGSFFCASTLTLDVFCPLVHMC